MRRRAVSTFSIFGDRNKHHLFLPARKHSSDKDTSHRIPSATNDGAGMSLCRNEIRCRRKRHSPIEFLVYRLYLLGSAVWRENGDVWHRPSDSFSQEVGGRGFPGGRRQVCQWRTESGRILGRCQAAIRGKLVFPKFANRRSTRASRFSLRKDGMFCRPALERSA